ncbi:DUF952 domain-containing protein [Streptomyces lunaelactis]|uniref:DUF952 domain-containing protein n=1 Tax=Streptomyces lunaelactis TaxID=1535768 RepID=UPI0015855A1D|nr:DUF952 domain-containing protein [Streptomyces lunaelactis]NUK04171.1 DUF952 domain-containing protein [Streptomyces lunaelactis]NUK11024.1 DUF952 domain-containing protein [Streptomyces lunaelactis]NUK19142.1 DUF952 domain-containing protein [Streptomyces lunaelactis]NUK27416.1 DUF952 domain-containing protein [Streptomyces lunaelactis]NUK37379.1 DUF952 domain-containing protein [Streptomyces lunaelactis]
MLFHVVPVDEWTADVERPYTPASLTTEGFVHCSPDEPTALAIADGPYRDAPDLLVLLIDEGRLGAEVRWEGSEDMLFPHVYGPIERAAVTTVMAVRRDADGRARELTPWA